MPLQISENVAKSTSTTGFDDLIQRCIKGCEKSQSRLVSHVHKDFYEIANRLCSGRFRGSMHATHLVNESFMRMIKSGVFQNPRSRPFLFSVAARTMRNVIADYLRKKSAAKRNPEISYGYFDQIVKQLDESPRRFEDLDEAMALLEMKHPRRAEIVNMRYFFGMTVEEIAASLDVSKSTVESDWRKARVWLFRYLSE